jgi:hypothetical protein
MSHRALPPRVHAQRGATAVEFALGALVFFVFVFGVIEMARALYMWSTLIEVTRRASRGAAIADFSTPAIMQAVKRKAIFADLPGGMPLRGNLTENNLLIDYLNGSMNPVDPMPACPPQNIVNCTLDPEGAGCIRFVRVRLCQESSGATCTRVDYVPIVGAYFFPGGPLKIPTFATVTPVSTLGYQPGAANTCP